MELQYKTVQKDDGKVEKHLCLIDSASHQSRSDSGQHMLIFGALTNGGMTRLTELVNKIHVLLLETGLYSGVDSVVSCRAFGNVFAVSNLLEKTSPDCFSSQLRLDPNSSYHIERIALLITALLESRNGAGLTLKNLNRHLFCQSDLNLTNQSLESTGAWLEEHLDSSRIWPRRTEINSAEFLPKLSALVPSEYTVSSGEKNIPGWRQLSMLAGAVRAYAEEKVGTKWESINDHLASLNAVEIELDGVRVYLTTRPTATQISLFNRMKVPMPPLLIPAREIHQAIPRDSHYNSASSTFTPDLSFMEDELGVGIY